MAGKAAAVGECKTTVESGHRTWSARVLLQDRKRLVSEKEVWSPTLLGLQEPSLTIYVLS